MKLWRKLAKKDPITGQRNGRNIKHMMWMQLQMHSKVKLTSTLFNQLVTQAKFPAPLLSKKQLAAQEAAANSVEVSNEAQ
jgi:hypothetical protein